MTAILQMRPLIPAPHLEVSRLERLLRHVRRLERLFRARRRRERGAERERQCEPNEPRARGGTGRVFSVDPHVPSF